VGQKVLSRYSVRSLGLGVVWVGWGVGGLTRAKPGNCTSVVCSSGLVV
jgi:hypothetical protein